MAVDGFKINVPPNDGSQWLGISCLNFQTKINLETGEISDHVKTAKHKGLIFTITKSKKYENLSYYNVRGSLHKYYNKGIHNANDFTFQDLQEVVTELKERFKITPETASFRNIEFGVNIITPIPAKDFVRNIVAHKNHGFASMIIDSKKVGRTVSRHQYKIKVYDKGGQYPDVIKENTKNLIRFEISVKKMAFISACSVKTLADLMNPEKANSLCEILIKSYADIIYFDKKLNWRSLTNGQQKKMLYYATPRNWEDFNRQQRADAKKRFKKLTLKSGVTNTFSEVGRLIVVKFMELAAIKSIRFYHDFGQFLSRKKHTFLPLEYPVKMYVFYIENIPYIFCPKSDPILNTCIHPRPNSIKTPISQSQNSIGSTNGTPSILLQNKKEDKENPCLHFARNSVKNEYHPFLRKCKVCDSNISHKIKRAVYCNKKCNNAYHSNIRKMNRQDLREKEKKVLDMVLELIPYSNLSLSITYGHEDKEYTDDLKQNEIQDLPNMIQEIKKVVIHAPTRIVTLTSYRAKSLIKSILQFNKNKSND